jgi:hypothetical protein
MTVIRNGDIGIRYRVAEVHHAPDPEPGRVPYAFTSTPREFRTPEGATAYRDRMIRTTGRVWVIQCGVVQWLTDNDVIARVRELQAEGATLQ